MPKLSIIIPTRERADTLRHTLRTLVEQDIEECEFLVSDNFSQDSTQDVVNSFSDSRVIYKNTGRRLSMSDNWEFALTQARGKYISYIGDDDGFIKGSLSAAIKELECTKLNALVWEKAEYCWPDYIEPNMRNWITLRVGGYKTQVVDGNKERQKVVEFKGGYTTLPCLYNGIVNRNLLLELKNKSINKVFFNSISPDAFSGLALSSVIGEYLLSNFPFSVSGASRHSNGTSFMRRGTDGASDNPTTKFYSENKLIYDSKIILAPSIPTVVMGEYLLIKKYLPILELSTPSWDRYVVSLIKDANGSFFPEEVLKSARHTVMQMNLNINVPGSVKVKRVVQDPRVGLCKDVFGFSAPEALIKNIYDACQLVSSMVPDASCFYQRSENKDARSLIRKIFR